MNANTTWIVWFAAALFCGGLALLLLRLAWWWWALSKIEREIEEYECKRKQQEQEIRHMYCVRAELEQLLKSTRDFDDVAPWQ